VLLDRRKVKFWQKIIFSFMALLMVVFIMGYAGFSWLGCGNDQQSAVETLDQEVASAKTATAAAPTDATAWTRLAEAYLTRAGTQTSQDLRDGDLASAAKAYKKADKLLAEQKGPGVKAQRLDILNQMATVYAELNEGDASVRAMEEITALTPKDAQAFLNLGLTARNAGDTSTALLAFSKFLQLDPKSPYAQDVKDAIAALAPQPAPTPSPSPTQ